MTPAQAFCGMARPALFQDARDTTSAPTRRGPRYGIDCDVFASSSHFQVASPGGFMRGIGRWSSAADRGTFGGPRLPHIGPPRGCASYRLKGVARTQAAWGMLPLCSLPTLPLPLPTANDRPSSYLVNFTSTANSLEPNPVKALSVGWATVRFVLERPKTRVCQNMRRL